MPSIGYGPGRAPAGVLGFLGIRFAKLLGESIQKNLRAVSRSISGIFSVAGRDGGVVLATVPGPAGVPVPSHRGKFTSMI